MADSGTIHELKVAIRVALEGYKKDMASVKSETKKAREAISSETSKIRALFGKVNTQKAGKEVERLTSQLERQKERINQQENVIKRLKAQYESLVSGITKDRSVSGIEKQLKSTEKEFDIVKKKLFELYDQYDIVSATSKNGVKTPQMNVLQDEIDSLEPKYESLGRKVMMLSEKLKQVQMNPETSSQAQDLAARLDAETQKLERMKNEAGTVKEKLDAILHSKSPPGTSTKISQIISRVKELAKSVRTSSAQMVSGFNRVERSIDRVKTRIGRLVGTVLVFNVLRKAVTAFREHLGSCLKTNSEFTASLNAIKTNLYVSFSSIYTAVLPAINALMSALAAITGALATIVSGIFGKTYAQSLQTAKGLKSATAAVNGYNSAAKKGQTFSFDEVHNINKEESSGGGGSSLEDPSVDLGETEGILEKLQNFLKNFFAPFKEAWDVHGSAVVESARYALQSIKTLLGDICTSFSEVWSNGTGYQVCSDILSILENTLETIGNIATGLDDAWNFDNTGTEIVQDLFNILLDVLDAIDQMSEATSAWSAGLDFVPIMTSFERLLSVIEPLTSTVCDGLVWMYENVLLPFAGWTIEDAIPAFFDLLTSAIGLVNSVLETFEPLGTWLWDSFLQPIAEWTGGVICETLEILAEILTEIGDWISEHQPLIETLTIILGSLAAAVTLVNTAMTIWNAVNIIATGITTILSSGAAILAAAIGFITSPITLVIIAITALIAAGVLLWKNWDTVKEKATIIWNGLKDVISNVVNAILDVIEMMINGVVTGINAVIDALNGLSFDIPDWVPLLGGKSFGFSIAPIRPVSIPRMAKGGVVSSATTLIAGEAGREAIVPLENNTGWLDMVAARIAESINGSFAAFEREEGYGEFEFTIPITLELDGESLLKKLIKIRKRKGYPIVAEEAFA